jgi:hypothetical protein
VTVRFNEEELRRLDELSQRMGVTRSDVIRSLINNFEEALRREVDREGRRWFALGFVSALESAVLDPEVVLRFVRRNIDILGFPDFLIGMVRVRNRVVVFSHHDRVGSQLINLVRSKVEEEVKREEMEIEREEDEDGGEGVEGGTAPVNASRIIPVNRYRAGIVGKFTRTSARGVGIGMPGGSVANAVKGGDKSTASTTAPGSKKLASEKLTVGAGSTNTQPTSSNQRASANGSGKDVPNPVGQGSINKPVGDFVMSLITMSYHKHRNELLRLIESITGG